MRYKASDSSLVGSKQSRAVRIRYGTKRITYDINQIMLPFSSKYVYGSNKAV